MRWCARRLRRWLVAKGAAGVPDGACKCTPTCLASLHLATAAACPQAAEKLVLAEGSKMAVAAFQGSHDQGVYGVRHWTAVNRGGRGWVDRSRDAVQRRGVHRHAAALSACTIPSPARLPKCR